MAMMRLLFACVLAASEGNVRVENLGSPKRYLIASSPGNGTVLYAKIPEGGVQGSLTMTVLISDLTNPQGVAVDLRSNKLYVCDPAQTKIMSYTLIANGGNGELRTSSPTVVANNTDARWVAVDLAGTVFYTEEANNRIMKVPKGGKAEVAYNGATEPTLNAPGGLAIDSFNLFWVNKALGMQAGSVVKGLKPRVQAGNTTQLRQLSSTARPQPLAMNTDKSYGVCLAMRNVFYTQPEAKVFGITQTGSGDTPITITDRLTNPRGCTFDGDGTVYVADKGAGAIYSFAGNMQTMSFAALKKVTDVQDAFGVAVFVSSASRAGTFLCLVLSLLAAVSNTA